MFERKISFGMKKDPYLMNFSYIISAFMKKHIPFGKNSVPKESIFWVKKKIPKQDHRFLVGVSFFFLFTKPFFWVPGLPLTQSPSNSAWCLCFSRQLPRGGESASSRGTKKGITAPSETLFLLNSFLKENTIFKINNQQKDPSAFGTEEELVFFFRILYFLEILYLQKSHPRRLPAPSAVSPGAPRLSQAQRASHRAAAEVEGQRAAAQLASRAKGRRLETVEGRGW